MAEIVNKTIKEINSHLTLIALFGLFIALIDLVLLIHFGVGLVIGALLVIFTNGKGKQDKHSH